MLPVDKRVFRVQMALLFIVVSLFIAFPTTFAWTGALYFGLSVEPPFLPLGQCPGKEEEIYLLSNFAWIVPMLLLPFVFLIIKKLLRTKGLFFISVTVIVSVVGGLIFGIFGAYAVIRLTLPMEMQKVCECTEDIDQYRRSHACDVWKYHNQ